MSTLRLQRKTFSMIYTYTTKSIGHEISKTKLVVSSHSELNLQMYDKFKRVECIHYVKCVSLVCWGNEKRIK